MRCAHRLVSVVAISALLAAPAAAPAGEVTVYEEVREEPRVQTVTIHQEAPPEPDGVSMAADFLVARPLGLVATVAGTAVYVVAFPFAALAGDIYTPAEFLIAQPARFTFDRPLGQIDL
jgi:hypothetical protein